MVIALPLVHPDNMDKSFDCHDMLITVETAPGGTATTTTTTDDIIMNGQSSLIPINDISNKRKQLPSHLQEIEAIITSSSTPSSHHHSKHNHHVERSNKKDKLHSYYELKSLKSLPKREQLVVDISRTKNNTSLSSTLTSSSSSPSDQQQQGGVKSKKVVVTTTKKVSVGVSWMGWSPDGDIIAARDDKYPRCIWIYRPLEAQLLALIVQLEPITCSAWRPLPVIVDNNDTGTSTMDGTTTTGSSLSTTIQSVSTSFPVLAFCTGNNRVYFWTPIAGATWAVCPANITNNYTTIDSSSPSSNAEETLLNSMSKTKTTLAISSLHWSDDGQYLLVQGREAHCVCKISFLSLYHKATRAI